MKNEYDVNALEAIAQNKWKSNKRIAHLTDEELAKIKKKSDNDNPVSQPLQKGQMKIGNEICDFNSLASFLKSVEKIKKG